MMIVLPAMVLVMVFALFACAYAGADAWRMWKRTRDPIALVFVGGFSFCSVLALGVIGGCLWLGMSP